MTDELMVTTAQDQTVRVRAEDVKREMDAVDDVMQRTRMTGDPRIALHHVRGLTIKVKVQGIAAARILYELYKEWETYQAAGVDDDWENVAPSESGLAVETCRKYRDMYGWLFDNEKVPDEIRERLPNLPVGALLLVGPAARDGDLDEEGWKSVVSATSKRDVSDVIHGARGRRTSAARSLIWMEDRHHILKAKMGDEAPVVLATLRASRADLEGEGYEFEVRRKAIAELREKHHVLQQ